jgi:hypothetical protein
MMTISTTGYGDISPRSGLAKMIASGETLIGLAWTIVVFAAVLDVVVHRRGLDKGQQNGVSVTFFANARVPAQ